MLGDEETYNALEPTAEEIENKMKLSMENILKKSFKNQRDLARETKWKE